MSVDPIEAMRAAENKILEFANDIGKFGIEVGMVMAPDLQLALERLQVSGRIRLIDVSPVSTVAGRLLRIFLVTP